MKKTIRMSMFLLAMLCLITAIACEQPEAPAAKGLGTVSVSLAKPDGFVNDGEKLYLPDGSDYSTLMTISEYRYTFLPEGGATGNEFGVVENGVITPSQLKDGKLVLSNVTQGLKWILTVDAYNADSTKILSGSNGPVMVSAANNNIEVQLSYPEVSTSTLKLVLTWHEAYSGSEGFTVSVKAKKQLAGGLFSDWADLVLPAPVSATADGKVTNTYEITKFMEESTEKELTAGSYLIACMILDSDGTQIAGVINTARLFDGKVTVGAEELVAGVTIDLNAAFNNTTDTAITGTLNSYFGEELSDDFYAGETAVFRFTPDTGKTVTKVEWFKNGDITTPIATDEDPSDGFTYSYSVTDSEKGDISITAVAYNTKVGSLNTFKKDISILPKKGQPAAPVISCDTVGNVTITADEGTKIYYTSGASPSDPTTSSTLYEAPFTVTEGHTVKAFTTGRGFSSSSSIITEKIEYLAEKAFSEADRSTVAVGDKFHYNGRNVKVFYTSGEADGNATVLAVFTKALDAPSGGKNMQWGSYDNYIDGVENSGGSSATCSDQSIGAGAANTAKAMADQDAYHGRTSSADIDYSNDNTIWTALKNFREYIGDTEGKVFIPSLNELVEIAKQKEKLDLTWQSGHCWSSSENGSLNADYVHSAGGSGTTNRHGTYGCLVCVALDYKVGDEVKVFDQTAKVFYTDAERTLAVFPESLDAPDGSGKTMQWGSYYKYIDGVENSGGSSATCSATAIGTGEANTALAMADPDAFNDNNSGNNTIWTALQNFRTAIGDTEGKVFIPSALELMEIWNVKGTIGITWPSSGYYWSSSESGSVLYSAYYVGISGDVSSVNGRDCGYGVLACVDLKTL